MSYSFSPVKSVKSPLSTWSANPVSPLGHYNPVSPLVTAESRLILGPVKYRLSIYSVTVQYNPARLADHA
jgi:hypothetical protein